MRLVPTLLVLAAFATPAVAQRSFVIERFDAAIVVNRDGTIDVTETISPRFTGKWNGIYRTIPVKYRTPQGFNWTLRLKLVSVTDASGDELKTETSRERHYLKYKIWVPGAVDATKTVVLRYRAENGLRFFEDHDELYWNVTGDEWEVPIEAAAATITLPNGAEGVRAIAFNGVYGSTARDASVEQDGTTIRIAMPHRLEFHEGLTAVIGWNKGLVAEPTQTDRAVGFLQSNWPLGLPIVAFFGMFALWRRHGRDPKPLPIPVQYEPPADLTPAEAGTLMDNSADMRDITATLVDLAVQGHLRIEEREERKLLGLIKDQEFVFHRLEPPADARELAPHEQRVLSGVFSGGVSTVELSDLENEFYTSLPGIKRRIFDRLITRGYYRRRPHVVQGAWIGGGIAAGVLIGVVGGIVATNFSLTPVPFIVAGALVGLIVVVFGAIMPARTVIGARARERVLGFEDFLHRVESDKYRRVVRTPEMFERFLPFAMAFGVEKQWANAFQDIFREPPRWYSGNLSTFNAGDFSGRMSALSSRAGSTMASSPRSSGGSGFSGGSSGGGGGGGGGGGF
ncbi:MAG: DUF2207 domain-containing protein [Gemmatimonadales bacterium]|nr:DUF2207 domain-containing protein [Gemmatimonadales bacterium]